MSFSNTFENTILQQMFGSGLWLPNPIEVGLGLNTTEDAANEISGYNYARVPTTPAYWSVAFGGIVTNDLGIRFPQATGTWTATHVLLFPQGSGNYIYIEWDETITVKIGKRKIFGSGELIVLMD